MSLLRACSIPGQHSRNEMPCSKRACGAFAGFHMHFGRASLASG